MSLSKLRVGLTYDLREDYLAAGYSEHETAEFDSIDTINSIENALQILGYETDRIGNIRELAVRLVNGDNWDLVFNICEGMHGIGREAQVPGLLDAYQIPYVFSDTLVCALTLHKGMTKDVVRAAGISTPDYAIVRKPVDVNRVRLALPLFAKPIAEGTGKGISANSKINSITQLRAVCLQLLKEYPGQSVLVERFLPGREFTVGILGTGQHARALATLEIQLLEGAECEVYSYHNKENWKKLVHYRLLPAGKLRQQVEDLALNAWRVLGCRDGGRIDVRLDENGNAHFLEVNPLAGIRPEYSDLPIMAALVGMNYVSLIQRIMTSALQRIGKKQILDTVAA